MTELLATMQTIALICGPITTATDSNFKCQQALIECSIKVEPNRPGLGLVACIKAMKVTK